MSHRVCSPGLVLVRARYPTLPQYFGDACRPSLEGNPAARLGNPCAPQTLRQLGRRWTLCGVGASARLAPTRPPAARRMRGAESRHSSPFFPLSRHGPVGSSPTAGNADRAVPVDFRRLPAVIQASCALPCRQGAPRENSGAIRPMCNAERSFGDPNCKANMTFGKANMTFGRLGFTVWPLERSGPARMHRRPNAAGLYSTGCQGLRSHSRASA